MKVFLAIAALTIGIACQGPTDVIGGRLDVRAGSSHLELTNHSPAAVYYNAKPGGYGPAEDWGPCIDPESCDGIAPGERLDLPYSVMPEFESGHRTVWVYWWHLVPTKSESGFRADSIRTVVVEVDGT